MKKNISINLFGTLYNIDEDAYNLLENYLDSMKRYFSRQEGGEEIADDIEARIAELLDELKDLFTRCEESRYAGGGSLDGATACRRARELVRKLESLKLKA